MCHAGYISVPLLLQNKELGVIIHVRADAEEHIGVVALFSLALKSEQLRNFVFTYSHCSQNRLSIIVSIDPWGCNHGLMLRHQDHRLDGRIASLLVQAEGGDDGGNNDSIHKQQFDTANHTKENKR